MLTNKGAGDFLHDKLRERFKKVPSLGCNCSLWIRKMNRAGPAWCRKNLAYITAKLKKSAKKYGWWKYVVAMPGAKCVLKNIVLDSIREAEEAEKANMIAIEEAKALEPIDVVYTLSNESKHDDFELRYSLRSLEKHGEGLGRVFVVGHKPHWLTGVIHIPHEAPHANKDADIVLKLLAACEAGVSERFIFASDDQMLLGKTRLSMLPAHYWKLPNRPAKSKWEKRLWRTCDYLREHGVPEPLHFDTHIFQPQCRTEFMEAVKDAPYNSGMGYTVNTLTLNNNQSIPRAQLGSSKLTLYRAIYNTVVLRRMLQKKSYLGYNDRGLTSALKLVLQERFPERSRFELDEPKQKTPATNQDMLPSAKTASNGMISRNGTRALMLRSELEAVIDTIPDDGTFLEIGTYHGLTASLIASARPNATIYSLDPLYKSNNGNWQKNRQPNMRLVVGTIDDMLKLCGGQVFDSILVDGDHHCQPCYRDLWACQSLIKPGGALMAHDYVKVPDTHIVGKPGVHQAVKLFCKRYPFNVGRVVGSVAFLDQQEAAVNR